MESHLLSQAARFRGKCVSRSAPIVAAFVLAAQVVAQNPVLPNSVDDGQAATGSQQIAATPSAPSSPAISAPAPVQEEASVSSPQTIPFLALAAGQDGGQSSSQTMPVAETAGNATKTKATNTNPPHHALGVTLVVVGVTALVAGSVAYALGRTDICSHEGGHCGEARDAGIAFMPIGAGVAALGFYFQFHR